jgi:hypothetical protein
MTWNITKASHLHKMAQQASFKDHDWDSDAQWKDYLSRIDFLPSNYSSSTNVLQKLKEKYWKKYVVCTQPLSFTSFYTSNKENGDDPTALF